MNDFVKHPEINILSKKIIGAAIEVHRHLGPGLLESAYKACLAYELEKLGLLVERQKACPLVYKDLQLPQAYRLDLCVEEQIVIELKVVEKLSPVHAAQVLSYLKFSGYPLGLLINFNVRLLRDGIRRFIKQNETSG
ncbi:MAG: GxxExxY protein [Chloroflexota bacterium]